VLTRPLTLKPRDRIPPALGAKIRAESARLNPATDESGLAAIVNGTGLSSPDTNGFRAHATDPAGLWLGNWTTNLSIEFELPEAAPLSAIEVWNYNGEWDTTNGLRKVDVAVSADGTAWRTVLTGAEIAEADGTADYDEPTVLQLNGVTARRVRFEHLVPWGTGGKVGLSEVVFHQAPGSQSGPLRPEDGSRGNGIAKPALEWTPGKGATEHRVYFGTSPDTLAPLGAATEARLDAPELKPDTAYFWRVDEVKSDGGVITGRVAKFETSGLVAWWRLDEAAGAKADDATGHQLAGRVQGQPRWAPGAGRLGGAMEFTGNGNFILCGNNPEFEFRDGMTVAVWIKVRQFDKVWQAIVTKGDHGWRLQRNKDDGRVMFIPAGPKSAQGVGTYLPRLFSKRAVDDGQWHHLVGLYNGRRAALYVDGELEDSLEASGPLIQNRDPVMIGENSFARGRWFNGWIDDVRLYGYGLSEEEVRTLYRADSTSDAN
jgi:Concanavalin A-like lectin/glucanases superfamily/F5/8 type C domain